MSHESYVMRTPFGRQFYVVVLGHLQIVLEKLESLLFFWFRLIQTRYSDNDGNKAHLNCFCMGQQDLVRVIVVEDEWIGRFFLVLA
jgi:hypothetical protein